MKRVVLDTNVLVSALWSETGNAARIFEMFLYKEIALCYDARILMEYKEVLNRPLLQFTRVKIGATLNRIRSDGFAVVARPCELAFADEGDKKFYEVALACDAALVTGNLRHYPSAPFVQTPAQFLCNY